MTTNEPNKTIQEKILSAIGEGKITMRPKWHFVLKAVTLTTGGILILLALIYLISFIIFSTRQNGTFFAPGFGVPGMREFLLSLPWVLILLSLVFILLLEYLVRHFEFGYGKPLIYSAMGIIILATAGGIAIASTPLHRGLFMQAQNGKLPFGGEFYKQYGKPPRGKIITGTVIEFVETGFKLEDPREQIINIVYSQELKENGTPEISEGDNVVIFGRPMGSSFEANGIREVEEIVVPMPQNMRGRPY